MDQTFIEVFDAHCRARKVTFKNGIRNQTGFLQNPLSQP